ncbi:MAG TPA: DUF427 domain-containing protein, partial [Steroidobacteraceae bacterium]|nr:DUF427 domain-containing protein [Steroidobacteraceae bacterium]
MSSSIRTRSGDMVVSLGRSRQAPSACQPKDAPSQPTMASAYCSRRSRSVQLDDRVIADSARPVVLFESGFAPRWYVPPEDIDARALTPAEGQTFCPYKGLASYYDIGIRKKAAWSYLQAWPEVARVSCLIS